MRDFPVFDTPYGVASLTLKEIPYRGCAYIRVLSVFEGQTDALLRECVSFCRICGAERIYAADCDVLESYPLYTVVYEMCAAAKYDEEKAACLFPVTEKTVSHWRAVYNEAMRSIDNASTLETRDEKDILLSGGAYFVHRDATLLGIAWLEDDMLRCIASCVPGMGECVMHSILSLVQSETLRLEVASTNVRAVRLYERMGFVKVKEVTRWYCVSV